MVKEYEIKFGKFNKKKFEAQIPKDLYYDYLNLPFFNDKVEYERSINIIKGDLRKTIDLNRNFNPIEGSEKVITKVKLDCVNRPENDIRISVCEEKNVKNSVNKGELIRYKNRITKYSDQFQKWRFDFTKAIHLPEKALNKNSNLKDLILSEIKSGNEFFQVEAEYLGKTKPKDEEIQEIINAFSSIKILQEFTKLLGSTPQHINFHRTVSQVKNLKINMLPKLEGGFAVTDKADGVRSLIYINSEGKVFTIDKAKRIEDLGITVKKGLNSVLDCEFVDGKPYLFDVLVYEGKDLRGEFFEKRYSVLEKFCKDTGMICKKFYLKDIFKNGKKIWKGKYPYELDGLIYTPLDKPYVEVSYKWKPPSMQTADFLIKKDEDKGIWKLYGVSSFHEIKKSRKKIDYDEFPFLDPKKKWRHYPVYYTSTDDFGDEWANLSIVEFKWDGKKWIPTRFREDKTAQMLEALKRGDFFGPNSINTIKSIWNEIQNPVLEKWLFGEEPLPEIYYTGNNKGRSTNMRKFHNWVKMNLYKKFIKKGGSVLEIASGRGGDLRKLDQIGVKNAVMMNIAKNGLQEAEGRYNKMNTKMNVKFIEANATTNVRDLLPKMKKYDVVSIMFAFHYFIKHLDTIFANIDHGLKKGGYLMLTTFDKNLVKEINNETFKIKKKNENTISVYAESIGERDEYLVDYDKLIGFFATNGYSVEYDHLFKELYGDWGKNMGNQEKEFSFMNRAIVFKKM